MREWVDEGGRSRQSDEKNIKYCDLLEVYNSMERDILRRTHNIFSSLKDESGNKYDNANTNVSFVDDNTLKYQNIIKKMDAKRGGGGGSSGSGSGSGDDSDEDEIKPQADMITANIKHVGKGVIVQSYDISDDDDEDDDKHDKKGTVLYTAPSVANKTKNKNVEYIAENNIDVDDI
jgi:hypothetical protein